MNDRSNVGAIFVRFFFYQFLDHYLTSNKHNLLANRHTHTRTPLQRKIVKHKHYFGIAKQNLCQINLTCGIIDQLCAETGGLQLLLSVKHNSKQLFQWFQIATGKRESMIHFYC